MKFLFLSALIFHILINPNPVRANDVILLTSVDFSKNGGWFRKEYYRTYHQKLEKQFRKFFENGKYRLVVRHYAHQDTLWDILQSPQTTAVFWVSHAGAQDLNFGGIQDIRAILDEYGYDLAPIFQGAHRNLKYLAIIGCNSTQSIQALKSSGLMSHHPELPIEGFDNKIDATDGLDRALELSRKPLEAENGPSECTPKRGYPLVVTRTIPEAATEIRHPPVRLELKGKILTVFPTAFAGETQTRQVFIDPPVSDIGTADLKFVLSSGANALISHKEISLGAFQFSSPWKGAAWQPFSTAQGIIFGVTHNVYRYTGPSSVMTEPIHYVSPASCDN